MSLSSDSNDLRIFHFSQLPGAPLSIGRKGSSWFLCFSRPYGAKGVRMKACLNQIHPSYPFPSESREGHSKFVFNGNSLSFGILQDLLTVDGQLILRKTGVTFGSDINELPEVELLITRAQTLRCCARCNKWEAMRMPRFQLCSRCKMRYYCSKECQKADWKPLRHKSDCQPLKDDREAEVEARRRTHDNNWWINNKMREMEISYEDADDLFEDPDYFCYGAR